MEDRFIDTSTTFFMDAAWDGANHSGMRPVCDKVLILPDHVPDMVAGMIMPDEVKDSKGAASMTGVIIACGPQAFAYDSDRLVRWEGERPTPGDRVWFVKYAGQEYQGRDGLTYRIMQDRAIAAMEDDAPQLDEGAVRAIEEAT